MQQPDLNNLEQVQKMRRHKKTDQREKSSVRYAQIIKNRQKNNKNNSRPAAEMPKPAPAVGKRKQENHDAYDKTKKRELRENQRHYHSEIKKKDSGQEKKQRVKKEYALPEYPGEIFVEHKKHPQKREGVSAQLGAEIFIAGYNP
jgi:hypothetical protein